jgi:hypothetical protein
MYFIPIVLLGDNVVIGIMSLFFAGTKIYEQTIIEIIAPYIPVQLGADGFGFA